MVSSGMGLNLFGLYREAKVAYPNALLKSKQACGLYRRGVLDGYVNWCQWTVSFLYGLHYIGNGVGLGQEIS